MDEIRRIKLFRLIVYIIASLFFFIGALLRLIGMLTGSISDIVIANVLMVSAIFYLLGSIIDTTLFIKE